MLSQGDIITIIVLLILAVVAISAVQGDGIISKAKLARTNYQTAQDEENTILENYIAILNNIGNDDVNSSVSGEKMIIFDDYCGNFKIYGNDGSNKQYINYLLQLEGGLEGVDYSTWNKIVDESTTTYSETLYNDKDNCDYEASIKFYPNVTVDKNFVDSLMNEEGEWFYSEIGSEYIYSFNSEMNGWNIQALSYEIENFTEDYKREICTYSVSDFSWAFGDNLNLKSVPTIPLTAKNLYNIFHHSENINEVNYEGTIEQYKQIESYDQLYTEQSRGNFTVHCSDGDFIIENN